MAPGGVVVDVVRIPTEPRPLGTDIGPPTTPAGLRALTEWSVMEEAAQMLADSTDAVAYASTTSAYAIGFEQERELLSRVSDLLGVPVASTGAAAVFGLRVLGIQRVALVGAPWFTAELNDLGAAYFRSQGFDVVSSASAGLWAEPAQIEPADVVAWTSHHIRDDADAVFIGGNGFRAAAAIEPLEAVLGRPVLTANQVLLWKLLAGAGGGDRVTGFGRLFEHEAELSRRP